MYNLLAACFMVHAWLAWLLLGGVSACPARLPLPLPPQLLEESQRVHLAFTGEFGHHTTSPRQLTSEARGAQEGAAMGWCSALPARQATLPVAPCLCSS